MATQLVVPVDGTPEAASALPLARTLAQALDASLVLVTAIRHEADEHQSRAETEEQLECIASELRPSVPVSTACIVGEPAEAICRVAAEHGARFIVMATHGRVGLNRAFAGSVAERVVVHSTVPVVLLRPGGARVTSLQHLLVPVDGTTGAALALGAAVELARATGAALHLLEVTVPIPLWAMSDPYGGVYIDPSWDDEALASAQAYVAGLAARLQGQGLTVEGRALMATDVGGSIIKVADEVHAELIVMATHAHTGAARTILGSVADQLVRESHRPVLLMRRDETAAPEYTPLPTGVEAAAPPV